MSGDTFGIAGVDDVNWTNDSAAFGRLCSGCSSLTRVVIRRCHMAGLPCLDSVRIQPAICGIDIAPTIDVKAVNLACRVLFPSRTPAASDITTLVNHNILSESTRETLLAANRLVGGMAGPPILDSTMIGAFNTAWQPLVATGRQRCASYVTDLFESVSTNQDGKALLSAYDTLVSHALPSLAATDAPCDTRIRSIHAIVKKHMCKINLEVLDVQSDTCVATLVERLRLAARVARMLDIDPVFKPHHHNAKSPISTSTFEFTIHVGLVVASWWRLYKLFDTKSLDRWPSDDESTVWEKIQADVDAAIGSLRSAVTHASRAITELKVPDFFNTQGVDATTLITNLDILHTSSSIMMKLFVGTHASTHFAELKTTLSKAHAGIDSQSLITSATTIQVSDASLEALKQLCTTRAVIDMYHEWTEYDDSYGTFSTFAQSMGVDISSVGVEGIDGPILLPITALVSVVLAVEKLTKKPSARNNETRATLCLAGLRDARRPPLRPPVPLFNAMITEVTSAGLVPPSDVVPSELIVADPADPALATQATVARSLVNALAAVSNSDEHVVDMQRHPHPSSVDPSEHTATQPTDQSADVAGQPQPSAPAVDAAVEPHPADQLADAAAEQPQPSTPPGAVIATAANNTSSVSPSGVAPSAEVELDAAPAPEPTEQLPPNAEASEAASTELELEASSKEVPADATDGKGGGRGRGKGRSRGNGIAKTAKAASKVVATKSSKKGSLDQYLTAGPATWLGTN